MKNVLFILTLFILVSCDNKTSKKNHFLIGMEFQNFKQIDELENYIKVSDTVIYGNNEEPKFGILHLHDNSTNLVVFKSITLNTIPNSTFKILDTLIISNLEKSEFITVGYCYINNGYDENIIAIVDKTDSLKIQKIKKVWKANTYSKKIEKIYNLDEISCFNEFSIPN